MMSNITDSRTNEVSGQSTPQVTGTNEVSGQSTPQVTGTNVLSGQSTPQVTGTNEVSGQSTPQVTVTTILIPTNGQDNLLLQTTQQTITVGSEVTVVDKSTHTAEGNTTAVNRDTTLPLPSGPNSGITQIGTTVNDITTSSDENIGKVTEHTSAISVQSPSLKGHVTVKSLDARNVILQQTSSENPISASITVNGLATIEQTITPSHSDSKTDIKTITIVENTPVEGVTSNIVMKSDDIFTQNIISPQSVREISEMTQYLNEPSILFTSSLSHFNFNNDFTSLTTLSTPDLIHDVSYQGLISDSTPHLNTILNTVVSTSSTILSVSTVDYTKPRINSTQPNPGLKPEDYVSKTTIQNRVISLNSEMDYNDSINSPTPNLSSHYPPSHPRVSLTHPPPSASQDTSDIVPTVTDMMSGTRSIGLTDGYPGSTVLPSGGFTTNPGSESSTQGATTLPINFTALYIAIPVCFIIILIAVGLSYIGFNKRKKKRWNSTNERRNLWLNTVSDVSIPINSVSTVSTDNDNKITTNLLSKSPATINKAQEEGLTIYRVLYQFEAQLDSQISLNPDEIVSVMEKADNGWLRGEVLGKSGWFPSSYVEEIEPVCTETLDKVEPDGSLKKKGTVTSFLLKKREKQRKRSRNKQIEENEALEAEKDEGIVSEVINMNDIGGVAIDIDDLTQSTGKLYKTVFQYKVSCKGEIPLNVGDVVVCYDRDRNGWMRGKNLNSNDEGWFPAVYVNEVAEEDRPTTPTPITYDQLSSNKTRNSNTEAIGIEHKAVYAYNSGKPEDLVFEAGDIIVVFETLDNGWWLGCHGDDVGWLPGSYLELLDKSDDSSSNASSSVKNFSIFDELEQMSVKSNRSSVNVLDDQLGNLPEEKDNEKSTKIVKRESKSVLSADFKPARKAPLPPSVKPQTASPRISLSRPDTQSMESITDTLSEKLKPGEKPELPVRFVKPKLVKVPKHSSKKLRHLAVQPQPSSRPLPPRPQKHPSQSRYRKYKPKDHNNQLVVSNGVNGDSTPVSSTPVGHRKVPPKPPTRNLDVESIDTKVDDLDLSMNSTEGSLNNSVGPKILNRISAHLLDELDDSMSPKLGVKTKRLKKVSPPVLPPLIPTNPNVSHNDVESPNDESKLLKIQPESSELKYEDGKNNEIPKELDITEMDNEFVTNGDMHIDMGKYLDFNNEDTKSEMDGETENSDVFPLESENETVNNPNKNTTVEDVNALENNTTVNAQSDIQTNQSKLLNELNKFVNNTSTENVQNGSKLTIPETNGIEKDNISNSSESSNQVRNTQKPKVPPKPLSPKPHVSRSLVSQPVSINPHPEDIPDLSTTKRTNLRLALRSFRALEEGELSFDEGSFIMDIDEESPRPGWCVGMLADGTTGLYPLSHVGTSRSELQTEL